MDDPRENEILPTRRDALKKLLAVTIGLLIVAIPGLAGLAVFLDPLRHRKNDGDDAGGGDDAFTHVATLDALPADGVPRKFQVLVPRVDAWNKLAAVPYAVYLKRPKDAPDTVVAFNVLCPHASCFVEPVTTVGGGFKCPCHNSTFNPDGTRTPNCVSPRDLDRLDVDEDALEDGVIRVRFQNFKPGTREKIARV